MSDDPVAIQQSDAIVLPGVGAFTDAMDTLDRLGMTGVLQQQIAQGVPFLGICLGMHLLFEGGSEHAHDSAPTTGLGVIRGIVERMPVEDTAGRFYKVPHVGWNSVEFAEDEPALFDGIHQGEYFYFTHSFIAPESDATVGKTSHSVTFPSAVHKGNAFGVQFHPEKSSDAGARLLGNFVRYVRGA